MYSYTPIPSGKLSRLVGTTSAPALIDVRTLGLSPMFDLEQLNAGLSSTTHSAGGAATRGIGSMRKNGTSPGRDTTRRTNMWIRTISQAALWLVVAGILSPAHSLTQEELVAKIEAAGYLQISEIKSTAEGTTAKAMKNGKEVRLVVDSSGQIKERN
jgi:hypothetical protein